MSLLAIITGILTLVNYAFLTGQIYPVFIGVFLQAVLTIVTFMTALAYRGRRQRRDYVHGGYKIFTLRFGIIMVSCCSYCHIIESIWTFKSFLIRHFTHSLLCRKRL